VQAAVHTLRHGYGVEDSAFVTLGFARSVAHVRLTWAARQRAIRFRFVGEQGEIEADDDHMVLIADKREEVSFRDGLSLNSSHSSWYAPLFRAFVARVRAAAPHDEGLAEAMDAVRFVVRAYESAVSGRRLAFVSESAASRAPVEELA
jgi:hypothetical protein